MKAGREEIGAIKSETIKVQRSQSQASTCVKAKVEKVKFCKEAIDGLFCYK